MEDDRVGGIVGRENRNLGTRAAGRLLVVPFAAKVEKDLDEGCFLPSFSLKKETEICNGNNTIFITRLED